MSLHALGALIVVLSLVPLAAASEGEDCGSCFYLWDPVEDLTGWGSDPSYHEEQPPAEPEPAPAPPAEEEAAPAEREPESGLLGLVVVDAPLPVPAIVDPVVDLLPIDLAILDAPLDLPLLAPATTAEAAPAPTPTYSPALPAATPMAQAIAEAPAAAAPTAAVVAVALLTAQPAFSFNWERVRRFGLFALLYTRIAKENLLDHERRDALLQGIREHPGTAVADLVKLTGVPRNTAVYHLARLEREGLVSSMREGRTRMYFAPGALHNRANSEALAALRHDTSRAIAMQIGQEPGLDQNSLCQKFGLAPSLAHWHADRLVSSGIVEKRREGRRVRYYPGASFSLVTAVLIAPAPARPATPPSSA